MILLELYPLPEIHYLIILLLIIGYPDSTPITRVIDGGEPPEFKSLFRKWTEKYQTKSVTYQRKHCKHSSFQNIITFHGVILKL